MIVASKLLGVTCFGPATVYAKHIDVLKGTAILSYSLEDDASRRFSLLQDSLNQVGRCEAVWHVEAAAHTRDWKHNAGVNTLTKRSSSRPDTGLPTKVQCNLKVPILRAGRTTLYFFPDRLLVYNRGGVGALPYDALNVQAGQVRLVESERPPRDATQIGTTWQFVNKKGGPDRRFKNNRQLSVMLYGELFMSSPTGLKELFHVSVPAAAFAAMSAVSQMKDGTMSISSAV